MRNTTDYKLAGVKTFRRSSKKLIGGHGGNLQNIEKGMRAIYEPDGFNDKVEAKCKYWLQTGDVSVFTEEELFTIRVFLQVDQSGAEALIVAYDCDARDYRLLFENSVKPHVYVALKLFVDKWKSKAQEHGLSITQETIDELYNTPIPLLKKNPSWRDLDLLIKDSDNWGLTERYYYLAKQTVHSANYDIQEGTFIMNILEKSGGKIVIKKDIGKLFLNTYRSLFPEIPERCERVRRQVEETKMLYNMHGHPYSITDYNIIGTAMKDCYAWGPQSTVGEITRIAFSRLQEWIESAARPFDILADTHDSYLVQCPLVDVLECKQKMQEFMNQRFTSPIDGVEFNMKSECQVGFNWSPAKLLEDPPKNVLGLQELNWKN